MGVIVVIFSLVYFAVFSLSSLCLGGAVLRRLGLDSSVIRSARGKAGIELALGMGLWSLVYLPLSAVGGLWTAFGKAIFIVFMVVAIAKWHRQVEDVVELYRAWRTRRLEANSPFSLHSAFGVLLAVLFILAFLNACAPISSWDELVDHMPKAKFIADNGAFADDPSTPFSGYPALCELLFSPLTGLTDELAAVTVFAFAVALLLMVSGFARAFLPPGWANPAAIIFFTMPLVGDLIHTALVDVPLACFCFGVFYLIALALFQTDDHSRPLNRYFFAAGLFLGFAMSVKYNGLLVALSWLIVLPITLLLRRAGLKRTIKWTLILFITGIVASGGWYMRNILLYGNPVHPFFSGALGGDGASVSIAAFTRPEMGKSWLDLLRYPIRLTFDYELIRHWYRAITPAFLCFIPLGLLLRRRDRFNPIFNLALWLGLVHLFIAYLISPGHTRYLLPLWAVWSPLAAFGMAKASDGSRFLRRFLVPLVLFIPLLLMLAIQAKDFGELVPYYAKQVTKNDVIARQMPSIKFIRSLSKYVQPEGKVLSIEPRVYYMPRDTVIGTPGIEAPDSPRWDEENTAVIAAELQAKGFTHLYIDFSSRQLKHAMAMDFFLATIPVAAEGRYYSYDGIIEEMEKKYNIAQYFTKEDLYMLSAMGGFDVYLDSSGRDWHRVERADIEERSQYTRNLRFIRHFWLMENTILSEIAREGTAVLYKINYTNLRSLRAEQRRYKAGRCKDLDRNPQLTPEIQYPDEADLTFHKHQKGEGMI